MRARRAVTLCIGVVPLLLGACGGSSNKDTSPQAKAFCAVSDLVKKLSGVLESEDPAVIKSAFVAAESALAAVAGDPPKDIATDIATIKTHFAAANDALKKANYVHQGRRQRAGLDNQELCVSVTASRRDRREPHT
ncbi:MAG: hypothetical protein E6G39_01440 [Actinobacteria bacterium]|nr:MAG: hypothetical protein E6G39_01440 [Actinomycetota bacterium]